MGKAMISDFAVASNGYCFFCLSQIPTPIPKPDPSSPLPSKTDSLQYLSRYLKMDLKKVFVDKGQVSPELLAKVEKARLNVELCEECRCLSKDFSEVYRQLEKVELELESILKLIHGKLETADVSGKLQGLTSGSNWNGLLEVLDVLRAEAVQKSFQKLILTPRVKVQNLSKEKIRTKQFRLRNHHRSNQESSQLATNTDFVSDPGLKSTDIKVEYLNQECLSDNDNGNDFCDDVEPMDDDAETRQEKIENDMVEDDNEVTENRVLKEEVVSGRATTISLSNKWSINPETGKRKCNVCKMEFNGYNGFRYHYQTEHLKLRFKCVSCNKLFAQKGNLQMHQRTSRSCSITDSATKFKCNLCEKSFTQKHALQRHLNVVHKLRNKYECDICNKKFNTDTHLSDHRRQIHGGIKRNNV